MPSRYLAHLYIVIIASTRRSFNVYTAFLDLTSIRARQ